MKLLKESRTKNVKALKNALEVFQQTIDDTKVTMEIIKQEMQIMNRTLKQIKKRL
jgi:hypothetical protein